MHYTITPLSFAEIDASEAVLFEDGASNLLRQIDCFAWLLRTQGRCVLVDTGIADIAELNGTVRTKGRAWRAQGRKPIAEQLADLGCALGDIDSVFLTHMHYDHASNIALFSNAAIYLGVREWAWAQSSEAREAMPQLEPVRAYLAALPSERRILLPDQAEPLPGIRTCWAGGHTPGSITVDCDSETGPVLMPGDAVFLIDNITRNTPIGLTESPQQSRAALERIVKFEGLVLPSHDPDSASRLAGERTQS